MKIATNQKKSAWKVIRKFFNDIHLWLGLITGLIVVAVCFSGTVYVFNEEIIEAAQPHLYTVEVRSQEQALPLASLQAKVEEASQANVVSVFKPASPEKSYRFYVKKKGEKSRRGTAYFVNQYTGEILGNSKEKSWANVFMGNMFSLHRWLLLDKIEKPIIAGTTNLELGRLINGWSTIIFVLLCISGMVIWFPKKIKYWKQGLKIKRGASWKRVNHDLHRSLAFYAIIPLFVMGLTGLQWSFKWYRTGLHNVLGKNNTTQSAKQKPVMTPVNDGKNNAVISLEQAIQIADKALPYKGDYSISLASNKEPAMRIQKRKIGFFAPSASDRLTVHVGSGRVMQKEIFKEKPIGQRISGSIKALHVGNVYGSFTKIIYFLACLIATSLPITGTLMWLNKLKKKPKKKKISV